jgi:PAS domain S-box-containing protein
MSWFFRRNSFPREHSGQPRRLSERLALEALNRLPHLAIIINAHNRISYVNSSVNHLLGWTPAELANAPALSLFIPSDHARLLALVESKDGALPETEKDADFSMLNKDGDIVRAKVSCRYFSCEKQPYACLTLWRSSVDDFKLAQASQQIEEFKQASENKSRFLANMSHEIRTPLNGMLGMIDLLSSSRLDVAQRGFVDSLKESSRNLRALLNDILDLSKIEAGLIAIENRPFDLVDTIQAVVDAFDPGAARKGLHLQLENSSSHRVFLGDALRLGQVVRNLVDNALKFTNQGGVTIKLASRRLMSDPKRDMWALRLLVSDTGIGIPLEEQALLFGSFRQANAAITRKYGGSGLGLNLSRHFVELMGGKINVTSLPGVGTEFEVTLQLEGSFDKPAFMDTLPPGGLESLEGRTILIVDDDLTNQVLIDAWLRAEGVTTLLRSNGKEAVDYIKSGVQLDAVLMDVSMPVMDGLTATRKIRAASQLNSSLGQLPIIGMSGHTFERERIDCLVAGMNGYLTKPLSRSVLLDELVSIALEKNG